LHIGDWGKPTSPLMQAAFLTTVSVQMLDGLSTTRDNVKGLLPPFMREVRFETVIETGRINTMVDTLRLHRGCKPSLATEP
jgi:hypothetical protein